MGREDGEHLQAVGLDAQQDQPLKEGLAEAGPSCLLIDDDWAQLAVVPHQHGLLGTQHQGDQRLGLCCLGCLVHQQLHVQS